MPHDHLMIPKSDSKAWQYRKSQHPTTHAVTRGKMHALQHAVLWGYDTKHIRWTNAFSVYTPLKLGHGPIKIKGASLFSVKLKWIQENILNLLSSKHSNTHNYSPI